MPKMKTHKAAVKRYKITGSGRVVRQKCNRGHLLAGKSGARKRQLAIEANLSKPLYKNVERMLGIRVVRTVADAETASE